MPRERHHAVEALPVLRVNVARHVAMLRDCYHATGESSCYESADIPWEDRGAAVLG